MSPCTHLSDRMPGVALGRARWTSEDEGHLAGCADCRAEWSLVAAASRLGARLPAIDADRVAALATERARNARARATVRTRWIVTAAGLAAAATVVLTVWAYRGGRGTAPGGPSISVPAPIAATPAQSPPDTLVQPARAPKLARGPEAPALELPMPELDSLPAEALDSILRALDEPLAQVGSDDLQPDESGDRELEQVLAGMEG
jgi:hypothetical protein